MPDQQIMHTNKLILRPFVLSDANRVQLLAGDIKIAETTLNIPHPYENGMAEAWIGTHRESFKEGKGVTYAIVKNDTNELIGAIGLMINPNHRKAELGYWIGFPYWSNGYCTEASIALIDYGFEELDLNKIYARSLVTNVGSWTVMENAGMSYEGTLRQEVIKDGIAYDLKNYAILKDEYLNS
jgi:RimJ/RimL family protein N-acetyltransferase